MLTEILHSDLSFAADERLLVGNDTRDDAAVYDLGDGRAVISTTDFFMPIVDDPFDFGRIAVTNAISDVYAMGGRPLMAIAVLGWPTDKLDASIAATVVDGGRQASADAGIRLAGGHSIDSPEPIFGAAVTGEIRLEHLKRNGWASASSRWPGRCACCAPSTPASRATGCVRPIASARRWERSRPSPR